LAIRFTFRLAFPRGLLVGPRRTMWPCSPAHPCVVPRPHLTRDDAVPSFLVTPCSIHTSYCPRSFAPHPPRSRSFDTHDRFADEIRSAALLHPPPSISPAALQHAQHHRRICPGRAPRRCGGSHQPHEQRSQEDATRSPVSNPTQNLIFHILFLPV
jgi:hypothetical protein